MERTAFTTFRLAQAARSTTAAIARAHAAPGLRAIAGQIASGSGRPSKQTRQVTWIAAILTGRSAEPNASTITQQRPQLTRKPAMFASSTIARTIKVIENRLI